MSPWRRMTNNQNRANQQLDKRLRDGLLTFAILQRFLITIHIALRTDLKNLPTSRNRLLADSLMGTGKRSLRQCTLLWKWQ